MKTAFRTNSTQLHEHKTTPNTSIKQNKNYACIRKNESNTIALTTSLDCWKKTELKFKQLSALLK